MNSVMSIEPFSYEAFKRSPDGYLVAQCDLVFHDNMENCMHFQIGHANARAPMIVLDEPNSFMFIERLPLFGIGWQQRIVTVHF
jgi:hypothetical protein